MALWLIYVKDNAPESPNVGCIIQMVIEGPSDYDEMSAKVKQVAQKTDCRVLRMCLNPYPSVKESKILSMRSM